MFDVGVRCFSAKIWCVHRIFVAMHRQSSILGNDHLHKEDTFLFVFMCFSPETLSKGFSEESVHRYHIDDEDGVADQIISMLLGSPINGDLLPPQGL